MRLKPILVVLALGSAVAACQSSSVSEPSSPSQTQNAKTSSANETFAALGPNAEIEPGIYTWNLYEGHCSHLTIGNRNSYTSGGCGKSPDFVADSVKVSRKGNNLKIQIDLARFTVDDIGYYGMTGEWKLGSFKKTVIFFRDVPPLDTLTIESPAQNVPIDYSALLGRWHGKLDNLIDSQLIIQNIQADGRVFGAFVWDGHPGGDFRAGRERIGGAISPETVSGRYIFTSEPLSNGSILKLKFSTRRDSPILGVYLRRVKSFATLYVTFERY